MCVCDNLLRILCSPRTGNCSDMRNAVLKETADPPHQKGKCWHTCLHTNSSNIFQLRRFTAISPLEPGSKLLIVDCGWSSHP